MLLYQLSYSKESVYKDGVKLTVSDNYLVPALESGIVIFIGNKEGYAYICSEIIFLLVALFLVNIIPIKKTMIVNRIRFINEWSILLYEESIHFSNFKKIYNKYFGKYIGEVEETKQVFNSIIIPFFVTNKNDDTTF